METAGWTGRPSLRTGRAKFRLIMYVILTRKHLCDYFRSATDILGKGGDYQLDEIVGRDVGGSRRWLRVVTIPMTHGKSYKRKWMIANSQN